MNVPIDNDDSLEAVLLLRIPGGNGGIVEDAKTHTTVLGGVVTGRANRTESVVKGPTDDAINRVEQTACGVARHG